MRFVNEMELIHRFQFNNKMISNEKVQNSLTYIYALIIESEWMLALKFYSSQAHLVRKGFFVNRLKISRP